MSRTPRGSGRASEILVDAGGDPGGVRQGGGGANSGAIGDDDNDAGRSLGADPRRRRSARHGPTELDDFDAVFAALAHRSRRTILSVLHARGGQMTSGDIAGRFDCSWPTTSQHLRVLEQAGLVTVQLHGREHIYRLQTARLHAVAGGWLARFTARGRTPANSSPPP